MYTPESIVTAGFYLPRKKRRAVITLTPLIDVVFILLVFFMLASSFLDWRSIPMQTSLPSTNHPKLSDDQPLLVSVSETRTRFNGQVMDVEAMLPLLHQRFAADPEAMVHVKPLGDTSLQAVIAVLDRLQADGISRMTMIRDRAWSDESEEGVHENHSAAEPH
uniref:Outer membrane transport energization protein ExbD n=1 Tax=Candidatus Kentrum sp. FW TaxID=2126338 RepID=A0A450SUG8_9GAMM|nr:MAG: outer membrane transport energization protein ExbD [Candidatus Kentron sp. FW]